MVPGMVLASAVRILKIQRQMGRWAENHLPMEGKMFHEAGRGKMWEAVERTRIVNLAHFLHAHLYLDSEHHEEPVPCFFLTQGT